ncbi:MAG: hypothetical protein HY558_01995 [Euryarchaeota archaeon]|nr:hypothetical protein [Euryarchaeota archaeon]
MFWIDPFLLLGAGLLIALLAKHRFHGPRDGPWVLGASAATLALFLFISIGMFADLPLLRQFAQHLYDLIAGPGATGTAVMLNGGIWNIIPPTATYTTLPPGWMMASILMFTLYPAYLWAGIVLGRLLFGRKPWHLGILGATEMYDAENLRIK